MPYQGSATGYLKNSSKKISLLSMATYPETIAEVVVRHFEREVERNSLLSERRE
jgi:hypothetical protein